MAEISRNTVLAVKVESTEGTPVIPAGATDFIALQDDLDISPQFDSLENAEMKSSIGMSKPIVGSENPTASFSHYLRHSGTEGQAPNYKEVLEAAFGTEVVASTQYDTVSSSTVSTINVDTGEGANFQRGQALLIKDATNGYSIRPVHSVSSDALTLGFNVGTAPGTGVNTGKAVLYKPANTGHQTLSLWAYRANRGALEVVSGARVTEVSYDFSAGEIINGSFSLEGIKYYFDPINITSTDRYLDFLDDATTRAAVIAAKLYKDPHELAAALETAMNALGSSNTFTVAYSDSTGMFTLTSTGTTFSLLWQSGTNTANTIGDKIGFTVSANDTGALTYTSDNAQSWVAPYTPTYDSADPIVAKYNEVFMGDATDTTALSASSVSFSIANERQVLNDVSAETGRSGSLIMGREVTINCTAYLTQHDVSKFKKFREGENCRFLYNFGTKSGGQWVAGKCGCIYVPTAVVSSYKVSDADGLIVIEMELKAYVDANGNGEVYLNFV